MLFYPKEISGSFQGHCAHFGTTIQLGTGIELPSWILRMPKKAPVKKWRWEKREKKNLKEK